MSFRAAVFSALVLAVWVVRVGRGSASVVVAGVDIWWSVVMERRDGLVLSRRECVVGGTMGLEGRESVVERWMFVRRVERKAGRPLSGSVWRLMEEMGEIPMGGINHRGGLRHVLGFGTLTGRTAVAGDFTAQPPGLLQVPLGSLQDIEVQRADEHFGSHGLSSSPSVGSVPTACLDQRGQSFRLGLGRLCFLSS